MEKALYGTNFLKCIYSRGALLVLCTNHTKTESIKKNKKMLEYFVISHLETARGIGHMQCSLSINKYYILLINKIYIYKYDKHLLINKIFCVL